MFHQDRYFIITPFKIEFYQSEAVEIPTTKALEWLFLPKFWTNIAWWQFMSGK